jgi:hypothetical protein
VILTALGPNPRPNIENLNARVLRARRVHLRAMTLVKANPHRLALLMVGAMAASVVGCGSGDGSDDDATRIEKAAPLDEVDLTLTSIGKFD